MVDRLLWEHFVHSEPEGGPGPCLTVDEAIALDLVPPVAFIVGKRDACICVDKTANHPIVCTKVDPSDHTPPDPDIPRDPVTGHEQTGFDLDGNPFFGELADHWTADEVKNELAAGMVATAMDCYNAMEPTDQQGILDAAGVSSDDDLADELKRCACPVLERLFADECPSPDDDDAPCWNLFLQFAECEGDVRLEGMLDLHASCTPEPPPPPEEPPEPPPDYGPDPRIGSDGVPEYQYRRVHTVNVWAGHSEAWPPHIPLAPNHVDDGVIEWHRQPYEDWRPYYGDLL